MKRIYRNGFALLLLLCMMIFSVSTAALEEADVDSDLFFDVLSEMPPEEEPAAEEELSDESDEPDFDEGLIIDFEDEAEIWDDEPDTAQTEESAEAEKTAAEEFETEETETEETETEETEDLLFEEEESGSEDSTELAAGEYNLWIMGVRVTSENRDKLFEGDPILEDKFSFTGKTLTFTGNLDYSYDGTFIENGIDGLEIQVPKGVTVQLHSTSGSGIKSSKSLTIEGRGSLTLTADMDSTMCGIFLTDNGKLTINNCSLNVNAPWGITPNYNTECSLEINNANIKVNSNRGAICDFVENGITLNGCVLRSPADGKNEGGSFVSSEGSTLKELEIGLPNGGYPIWLGNTQVTNLNKDDILGDGGKAKYDPATKTLTLNNPAIKGSYMWNANQGEHFDTLIFVENTDLTIKGSLTASSNTYDVIYAENGNLTLNNTNLTLKLPKPASGKFGSVVKGIGNLTIQGGTVRLIGEDDSNVWYNCTYGLEWYGIVTLNGGTLELTSGRSFAQIFNVNGGTVKFRGMYFACDHEITLNNAVLTAVGDPTGMGLTTNKALITNSTVTFGNGYLHSYMDFTISGSKVSITSPDYVPGILSNYDCITIDGSTVTAKGSEGIKAKKTISIQNSTVNAVGTTTHGIFGNGTDKIEVKGDTCTITAQGPKGAMVAAGISINANHSITTPAGGKLGDAAGGQTVYDGSNVATKVVIQYKRADYSKVDAAMKKIPSNLGQYTDASVKKVTDAKAAVKRDLPVSYQNAVDGMAAAIESAVKGLTYKPADYSKVDEALKKIPADLSLYTDASVKKVTDAKNAVKRGYNITKQSQVDAMAAAIENAVKGLVRKPLKLIAAYNGAHGIGVKWIKYTGATEYTVWQKYKGVWKAIKTVKPNDSSLQVSGNTLMYTDRAVKTGYGKGYIYSVSAKVGSTVVDYDRTGVAIYRLNPPALKKITNPKAGQVTVTWKGVFGRTETNGAYDLQYATEANAKAGKFTSVKKLPGYAHNVTSATVTGLKKGTKYVFRIRCSKTNKDRGTFYSEYSPWLSVTVKK